MKPDDSAAQQSTSRGLGIASQEGGLVSVGAEAAATAYPAAFASGSRLLEGVDLASTAGLQKLEVRDFASYGFVCGLVGVRIRCFSSFSVLCVVAVR